MKNPIRRIEKRKFSGKDFEHAMSLTGPGSKQRARNAAKGYRLRGFYTRVVQLYPGSHEVYIRSIRRISNPGTKWHVDRAKKLHLRMVEGDLTPSEMEATAIRKDENFLAAEESRKRGMNPTRKRRKSTSKGILPLLVIGAIVAIAYAGRTT